MAKKLDLFLSIFGKDQTGGMFSSVLGKADGLKNSMGNVTGEMRNGAIQAELFTKALDFGLGIVTEGAGKLKDAFGAAMETETSIYSPLTNNYAAIAGISFDAAGESVGRINAQLTKDAAALPGVTKNYRDLAGGILDNVLPAFQGIDGSLDTAAAEKSVTSLATSFGLLGSKLQGADVTKALGLTLSGKSISELGELLFFQENTALLPEIEKQLKAKNVASLKDLDAKSRLDLIQQVGIKFASPEYIAKLSNTASSLLEGFATTLFDQTEGVFGLMRDLDDKTEGSQSVYQQMGFLLDLVIGPKGVFGTSGPVANLFEAIGFKLPDPMRLLYRGFQKTVIFLEGAVEIGNDIAERIQKGASLTRAFGRYVGSFDAGNLGQRMGMITANVLDRGARLLSNTLSRVPWAKIGMGIGEYMGEGTITLFRNFPWGRVLGVIGKSFIAVADFILSTMVGVLRGVAIGLGDWVRDGVVNAAKSVGSAIWNAPGNLVQGGRAVSGPYRAAAPTGRGRTARRGADGYDPDNIMALVAAEQAAAPSESIIIANSGERIIPRGAQGNQGVTPGGGGRGGAIARRSTTVNFSPTLMLPQGSTRQMAEEVLKHLNALVGDSLESQLV